MNVLNFDNCPACGSDRSETVFKPDAAAWDRFRLLSQRKYRGYMDDWCSQLSLEVYRCGVCGHYWHHSQPDFGSIIGMYESGVSLNESDPAREPSDDMLRSMRGLFRLAQRNGAASPALLDYGSGRGRWARAAALAGFRVWAYEPSSTRANEGIGDFPVVNRLEALEDRKFDVVNLEQVLEHVQDPLAILLGLVPYTTGSSVLRVTVPNLDRVAAGSLWETFPFDGRRMHVLSPYEHLQGFTPKSMRRLLRRAGLVPERSSLAWRMFPLLMVRTSLGRWIPRLATTAALVRVGARRG